MASRCAPKTLAAAITPRSKVLMLNFPHQPHRRDHAARGVGKGIAALCQRHNLVMLTDEIYSELTYDGGEHTFRSPRCRA